MPLQLPHLDNRTFEQLVEEGRSRIPSISPQWTDQNYHDPGITIMELLAWLVEADLYRLDRTAAASYRTFLRLLGTAPHPARAAETVVSCHPDRSPSHLPPGSVIGDAEGRVRFQTVDDLHLSPARLLSVLTGPEGDATAANNEVDRRYHPFGPDPQADAALYLGFDQPLAEASTPLRLYVWAGDAEADRLAWQALREEWEAVQADAAVTHATNSTAVPVHDYRRHYNVQTVWEYYGRQGRRDRWLPLHEVDDQTRALTLSGAVEFAAPDLNEHLPGGINNPPFADHYFIRCRVTGGIYDCPPEIRHIALNAVRVRHAVNANRSETLGTSTGHPQQQFRHKQSPVVPGTTEIRIDGESWREVAWWDQVGPHDRAYVLDPETGAVQFGDGRQGRVPPAGAKIEASSYQVGGGAAGNVAAGTLEAVLEPSAAGIEIQQPFTAVGGAEAETLPAAQARVVERLNRPRRAVTLADFQTLALETPGIPVQRAFALADHHPAYPCLRAPGNVTVVIVPGCGEPKPMPSAAMRRAVLCYLERRRLVATSVHVVGPIYAEVTVHAQLYFEDPDDSAGVLARAREALDDFFHPLHGGAEGEGWPVGRDVYRAEIMALLHDVPGVAYVEELQLQADGCPPTRCGDLDVCPTGLITSGNHRLNQPDDDSPETDKEDCCE